MRKYFCDVCGKQFDPADVSGGGDYDAKAACPSILDVCPKCEARGRAMDVEAIVAFAWRAGMKTDQDVIGTKAGTGTPGPDRDASMADTAPVVPVTGSGGAPADAPAAVPEPSAAIGGGVAESDAPGRGSTAHAPGPDPPGKPAVPKSADPAPASGKKPGGPGSHWAEKRETMERLQAYRKNGGSTSEIAGAAGLPADTVRAMLEAKPRPIDEWRAVKAGLDKLEGRCGNDGADG